MVVTFNALHIYTASSGYHKVQGHISYPCRDLVIARLLQEHKLVHAMCIIIIYTQNLQPYARSIIL